MGRLQQHRDIELAQGALTQALRLCTVPGCRELVAGFAARAGVVQHGYFINEEFYCFLREQAVPDEYFQPDPGVNGVSLALAQFLAIDFILSRDKPVISTISALQEFVDEQDHFRGTFMAGVDNGRFIVYLERKGLASWDKFAFSADGDWSSVNMLDESLPFCNAGLDAIFYFLHDARARNPNDLGISFLGNHLVLKLEMDHVLRDELDGRFSEIVADENLRGLLPSFLRGLVAGDALVFGRLLHELPATYAGARLQDIVYALGAACPNTEEAAFKNTLDQLLRSGAINDGAYLDAVLTRNIQGDAVTTFVTGLSARTINTRELQLVISYLLQNIKLHHGSAWFKTTAERVMINADDGLAQALNHFLDQLAETDKELVFELLGARFNTLGGNFWLEGPWPKIVSEPELFSRYLTLWLGGDNRNVHWAVLRLCSDPHGFSSYFRLSSKVLNQQTQSNKLYLAYKIAGFIYSREHLQQLLFSLVEHVRPEEDSLLQNLFELFFGYVIYNYRGTLEEIDKLLTKGGLQGHQIAFYRGLKEEFEHYFSELDRVKPFKELLPGRELSEYVRFYRQQKFSAKFSEARQNIGLGAFFKETPVHSNRWAIRRPGQPKHEPHPMAHVESTTEFPSGEKLNPVFQERMRRTYQKIKQDEINID